MDPLHDSLHNRQATGFRSEGANLIGTSSDIAKQTFNRVGASDVTMYDLWEGIKRVLSTW
jgi:hypothetical protein